MSVSSLQIPGLCPNTAPCAVRTPGHCGPRSSSAPRACAAVALLQPSPFSCPGHDSPAGILSQNKCLRKDQIQQPQEPCWEVGWAGMKPSVTRPLGTQSRGQGPVCFLGLTPLLLSCSNLLHWIMWAVRICGQAADCADSKESPWGVCSYDTQSSRRQKTSPTILTPTPPVCVRVRVCVFKTAFHYVTLIILELTL